MIISFDFDETYTADPDAMGRVMELFMASGHTVIVTTGRGDHRRPLAEDIIADRFGEEVPVVRARGSSKRSAAQDAGYDVDVWVDDGPIRIECSHDESRRVGKFLGRRLIL